MHISIDDHSRYAYAEQHTDEKHETCARFPRRAGAHVRASGMGAAEAVMADNAIGQVPTNGQAQMPGQGPLDRGCARTHG